MHRVQVSEPLKVETAPNIFHLAARFVDFVTARPLTPEELKMVDGWLRTDAERSAFFSQPDPDQRHGLESARDVALRVPDRVDLVRAALLHDIGKRHSALGAIGRVVATLALVLRLPLSPRFALYRDHGSVGAAELADAEPVVVAFARHHQGKRPPEVSPADWAVLAGSDRARVRR